MRKFQGEGRLCAACSQQGVRETGAPEHPGCADRSRHRAEPGSKSEMGRIRVGGLKKQESGTATGRSWEWGTDPRYRGRSRHLPVLASLGIGEAHSSLPPSGARAVAVPRWESKVGRSSSHTLGAHEQSPKLPWGCVGNAVGQPHWRNPFLPKFCLLWKPTLSKKQA